MTDYAAVQKRLNELGASPPLVVDGKWGDKSKAALRAYQASRGLVADAVPGPKTLASLGLASASAASPAPKADPADVNAYAVAKRALPGQSEAERQYALSVFRGEGRYGLGWSAPPRDATALAFAKSKGLTGTEGAGSNNWGAEQGSGDAGSFPHVDFGWRNPDGTPWDRKGPKVWLPYIGKYKRWSTPEKGYAGASQVLFGGGTRGAAGAAELKAAIARGDLAAAVKAQHANGYFELDPSKYLEAVQRNYAGLSASTGWRKLLAGAETLGSVMAAVAGATAVTAAFWWWWHKRKGASLS